MPIEKDIPNDPAALRRRAEARLRRQKGRRSKTGVPKSAADAQRLLQELQVHHVELEMQNAELQEARDRMETLVEKYTDLYDFAPVGYFSVDESGVILEANLTGATLLGVDRSRLISRCLPHFVAPASQPVFQAFLKRVFSGAESHVCEAALLKRGTAALWGSFHGTCAISLHSPKKWCRVALSDITSLKQVEEAERRVEVLAVANRELRREIVRRQEVEEELKKSQEHQSRMLDQSHRMQEQLRHLSHQILHAQEEERKRISRELHDEIAQALTGINVRLAGLKAGVNVSPRALQNKITSTQRLVEKSVRIVHRFARELRPSVLDDLGLIPALHAHVTAFAKRARLRIRLRIFAGVEKLDSAKRTVLYRVAQEALTNVARHARATEVELSIEKTAEGLRMQVKDNGKSFPVQGMLHATKNTRLGLIGMRERVEMVGGSFSVASAPGQGTTVEVQIPTRTRQGG